MESDGVVISKLAKLVPCDNSDGNLTSCESSAHELERPHCHHNDGNSTP